MNPSQKIKELGPVSPERLKGSTSYFIKHYAPESLADLENAKCIFERYERGLLMRVFKNNKQSLIPLTFDEIEYCRLTKGKEVVNPYPLSPLWILLKLGVSLELARYFQVFVSEYSIPACRLEIKTQDYQFDLECNGYSFPSQVAFFKSVKGFNQA